ncbi:MAG: tetratricopeptide repeat protein [Chloroflexi bacterium]|nr:tetratricopeptide repeat protein [Chloroflexota bacterium]
MKTYPRTTRIPWASLMIIVGLLAATLAWMTLSLTRDRAGLVRVIIGGGLALAAAGGVLWLRAQARSAQGLRIDGPGRRYLFVLLVVLLLLALLISALPLSGTLAWVGSGAFLLCLGGAIGLGVHLARNGSPARYRQALYALKQGDEESALRLLNELEQDRPDFYGALYLRSTILRRRGQYQEALVAARALIERRPDLYYGYAEEGLTLLDLGRPLEARQALERAVQVAPGLAEAHYNLGMACAVTGGSEAGSSKAAQAHADEIRRDAARCALDHLGQALRQGLHDDVAELIARYYVRESFLALDQPERAARELSRLRRRAAVLRAWQAELAEAPWHLARRERQLAEAIARLIAGDEPLRR